MNTTHNLTKRELRTLRSLLNVRHRVVAATFDNHFVRRVLEGACRVGWATVEAVEPRDGFDRARYALTDAGRAAIGGAA